MDELRMEARIAVIGLGYVGLPVAMAFGQVKPVIGFDIAKQRIRELKQGFDITETFTAQALEQSQVTFTDNADELLTANFYIVAVPTPVDEAQQPDLSNIIQACEILSGVIKKNDLVVFESTVYPGTTQEICIPLLTKQTNLEAGVDFKVGYSPERINPSDHQHTFAKTSKIIAAEDEVTLDRIEAAYKDVVLAPLHRVSSIKVAEAAKVVENIQRDVNIALMNELAMALNTMDIDSQQVFMAASTKWNFMSFKPGLVGGHCLGVDPYYFIFKSIQAGYRPDLIMTSRRVNDGMVHYIANQTRKQMIRANLTVKEAHVAVLGVTFKENCADIRNSKSIELMKALQALGMTVQAHDPLADQKTIQKVYGVTLSDLSEMRDAEVVILCVAHKMYAQLDATLFRQTFKKCQILIDVKGIMPKAQLRELGISVWGL